MELNEEVCVIKTLFIPLITMLSSFQVEEASTPEKLKQLNVKNKRQLEVIEKDISKYFESGDIQNAKQQILKMKYYWSVASHINRLLRERGIAD